MFDIQNGANYSSKCPLAFPILGLNDSSSTATWGMDGLTDYSNNGHPLVTGNTFNSQGMVCAHAAGNSAETNVFEPDNFTFVICLNIPASPSQTAYIFSNFTPAAAPYAGIRLVQSTAGAGLLHVATGSSTSPTVTEVIIPSITGGPTLFSGTASSSEVTVTRSSGTLISTPVTGGRVKNTGSFLLNGSPVSSVNYGVDGVIIGLAFYNTVLSSTVQTDKREAMRSWAASKGIIVP
ncbi:hypothetical protein IM876_09475 [Serratia plymuthica]|uniref:hypothetical protein n=1 Tax=Serratia plymuthica TaxID=82996 RepID=UPI00192660B6|nr:hypothetical protein [Serratia plymuthica]MBL3522893.1 hypothetical protein [Serratia plymuthica]